VASVDLLGLPQDVVAPEDGVVVDTLVESGQGVEYGQELIVIEPARGRHGSEATSAPSPMTES
jgi:acetyl/propionyl-CoA carboxylase alpha subunit